MHLLDLFCGAGGAAMGYHRAGFEVTGIDIHWQSHYPFTFIRKNVMDLSMDYLQSFDFIHASPPCQAYTSWLRADRLERETRHPKGLIPALRKRLQATGKPWVIENVESAPLKMPVVLCGSMFPGLRVIRHRLFEASFLEMLKDQPKCKRPHPLVYRGRATPFLDPSTAFVEVTGGGNAPIADAKDAMGIDWMSRPELNEAIPPAYTQWIAERWICKTTHRKVNEYA